MNTAQVKSYTRANIGFHPRALIVEDDLTQVPIWEYILQRVNSRFSYDWVHDATSAKLMIEKSALKACPYDLVISDIYLSSSETGIDLWSKYGEVYGHKMILVSSISYPKLLRKLGPEQPTPMYINKPIKLHECISAVHSLLST
jgi:response regulator of citrate/malate metabolism